MPPVCDRQDEWGRNDAARVAYPNMAKPAQQRRDTTIFGYATCVASFWLSNIRS
ncbi:hypothetical protein PHLCEN_2v7039 [Hermanssonia centrifuga]|uniref:Uncharacterized protein n=1 Tax=Hermanssonia centrifuga TaxID=98765 RepID=A0A2R6NXN4_9APHY|nr:hypothetical protein PHLCEN_2v7039 [Hermanssonia centrifuga]